MSRFHIIFTTFMGFNILLGTALIGCKSRNSTTSGSTTKDVVVDRNGNNIALILGTPGNLIWAQGSMNIMKRVFESDLKDQGFKVETVVTNSAKTMTDSIADAAKRVADNGTLVISFTGHGSEAGYVQMENGGIVSYKQMAEAIVQNRTNPIRRTIFIIESCHSASALPIATNEQVRVLRTDLLEEVNWYNSQFAKEKHWERFQTDVSRLKKSGYAHTNSDSAYFGQVLVIASSSKDELSWGEMKSGYFAMKFEKMMSALKSEMEESATFQDLVNSLTANPVSSVGQKQIPQVLASPPEIVKDLLFNPSPIASVQGKPQSKPVSDPRPETLGLQWLNEVVEQVNRSISGCAISPAPTISFESSFLFSPEFIVKGENDQTSPDAYFGTMNWMSNPSISAKLIVENLTSGKGYYAKFGCTPLRK